MMFPPPYFTVFLVYFGFNSMFLGRRTYSFPSVPHKFILVSSVQRIFRHFSGGQCRCFFANKILFRIFFFVNIGTFLETLPYKLFSIRRFRTVCTQTLKPSSRLISTADQVGLDFDNLTINLSIFAVVALLLPRVSTVVFLFIALVMDDCEQFRSAQISL